MTDQKQLCVSAIRVVSAEAIQKANSGHPGIVLGAAPMAFELFSGHLRHDPACPDWPNRDRFILSAGHGSMLLYSLMHIAGYGLSITKLWGEENGGSYGYYLNDVSAYSLLDPVADGDYLNAFVYTDLEAWSDLYCTFGYREVVADAGANIKLTLNMMTFDENWNPVSLPVEGAILTIDGEDSDYVTDAEGNVQFTLDAAGDHLISARSDSAILVPPVCIVTVK